jgi:hypothetical protein
MKMPAIRGVIDRRILINYRIDPAVLSKIVPPPFEPKLVNGVGIAGICLIRLKEIRLKQLPAIFGFSSENAAHRIAVQWQANGSTHEGVYIPRRDTSSRFNSLVGGRLFPGIHHRAHFDVDELDGRFQIEISSKDSQLALEVDAALAMSLPKQSVFKSLKEASDFFESGSLGYSATHQATEFDGLELQSFNWKVDPLRVLHVHSSFFEDEKVFPTGSVEFDCGLLMRGIEHEWHARESLCLPEAVPLSVQL